ncbi:MAG: radical SAM protein, partial [Saprospiraceae bacterium]
MIWKAADTFNFLGKLTLKKLWNAALLLVSYRLTRLLRRPIQWGFPMTLSMEPTTACNLHCPECPSGLRQFTRDTGNLKLDFFRKTLDEMHDRLLYLIFYFQGEPYINPKFLQMVSHASDKGLYTITSTNGHFLDDKNAKATIESGLDRILISIDGTTQEVYEQYRKNGNLEEVKAGIRRLVHWKKELKSRTPHIVIQFLVVKPNEHQIPEIYQLGKELQVDDVVLKTAQVYDYEHGNPLIPDNVQYSRYKKGDSGTYSLKHTLNNSCWKLWHACVMTWDGWIVPCCFDKDAKYRLGSLRNQSFKSIWKGIHYNAFRSRL